MEILKITGLLIYFYVNGIVTMYIFDDSDLKRKEWFKRLSLFIGCLLFGTVILLVVVIGGMIQGLWELFLRKTQISGFYSLYLTKKYETITPDMYKRAKEYVDNKRWKGYMGNLFLQKVIERFEQQIPNYEIPNYEIPSN